VNQNYQYQESELKIAMAGLNAQPSDRVTLERGEQHADVFMHQVTVENLRRLFQVSYI